MTIGERIRKEREDQEMSRLELAKAGGIAQTTLSDLELGRSSNTTALHKLAAKLGVTVGWLETGRGPKHPVQGDEPGWLPIKASIQGLAAGAGVSPDEYAETHKLMFRAASLRKQGLKQDKLQVHYARGESMLPRIKDGDAMLIDTSDTKIKDGQIYWIRHEDHDFVKQLHKVGKSVVIESMNKANPQYAKPVLIEPGENFEVIGRVRWIGSWEG